ncbi:MAG: DEAD/DEAH box helicase [Bdellovibrionales bacterium]|nr:DEAD/DEAH box helicase [Bdellovibrionales bacterium]
MEQSGEATDSKNQLAGYDPFCAPEEVISAAGFHVVFRMGRHETSIRAHLKKRTKVKRLVLAFPGVHYIRSERCYYIPTHLLNDIVRSLRDSESAFAFDEASSLRLKSTAKLRNAIIAGTHAPNSQELKECMLLPFVGLAQPREKGVFSLEGYTVQQLECFLPKASDFRQRRSDAKTLSERSCVEGLYNCEEGKIKVWLTKEVQQFLSKREGAYLRSIKQNKSGFADALLSVVQPPCCWRIGPNGMGRLSIAEQLAEEIKLKTLTDAIPPTASNLDQAHYLQVDFDDNRLLDASDALKNAPRSKLFADKLEQLKLRREKLALRDSYLNADDWKLNLADQALEAKLYPHQRIAAHWLSITPRAFLGDDMGLGKTLTALTAFRMRQEKGESNFLLIVCPNSLVRNWIAESCNWFSDLTLAALPASKKARDNFLESGDLRNYDGLVVNFETVRLESVAGRLLKHLRKSSPMLCVDESQRAKNPQSKTFAALREISKQCPHRVLLTGTPTPKDISDIWSQVLLLDDGERFGTNYFDWLSTVAELGTKWSRVAVRKFKPEGVRTAIERVHEILLRRRKEDVLDLPEKTFAARDIALTGDQLKRYEEVRKELLLRVTSVSGEEYFREVRSIAEEYLRGVQLASNPRLVDPAWEGEPAKFLELDEIVQEVVEENEQKIVIWTNYLGNVRELVERYSRYDAAPFSGEVDTQQRAKTIRQFQESTSPKVLIALPAAGGVGITLTAAQTAVYLDKSWNAEHWMQSIDRLHRIGQRGTVAIISLHACKIDRLIYWNLSRKWRAQARLLGDAAAEDTDMPSRSELIEAVS